EQALEALRRAAGLCFDQEHGLLLSAPIYLLAPAGLRIMRRRASRATLEIVAIASVYVLPILLPLLNTHGWRGGWSPAARFLTPIMPLLALPVLYVFVQRRARVLVLGLLALQASLDVLLWSQPMLQWSEGTGMAPFILAVGGERLAAALPSLARLGGLDAAIMTGMAALWILISWLLGRERSEAALNNS
ncbi:MAG: hypothetical protein JXO72_10780, partial [Vicinamibacteria bacterium]|nr:hypothetical protein [Vicinamibacteria bacterium]